MALASDVVMVGTMLVVGTVLTFTLWLWAFRKEGQFSTEPFVRDRIDGDALYSDDRLNELLYATAPNGERGDPDVDPESVRTTTCLDCGTLNRHGYTFCRECGAKLTE